MLTEKQVLMGKSEAFASFGYAVANVGDLNLDGYPGKLTIMEKIVHSNVFSIMIKVF